MTDARLLQLAQLRLLAGKVALVHGPGHPDMGELAALVERLAAGSTVSTVDAARLRALTDGFTPWTGACASVRALFAGLAGIANEAQP